MELLHFQPDPSRIIVHDHMPMLIFSYRKIDALVLLFSTCTVCTLDVPCSFHHIERERDKWIGLALAAVAIWPRPADKLFISHEEKYNSQFRMRAVPVPLQVTLLQCQHVCCLAGRARDPANSNGLDFVFCVWKWAIIETSVRQKLDSNNPRE